MNAAVRKELLSAFAGEVYRGVDGRLGAVWFTPNLDIVINVHLITNQSQPACLKHIHTKQDYSDAKATFMTEIAPFIERVYPNLEVFDQREFKTVKNSRQWAFTLQHRENLIVSVTNIYPNTSSSNNHKSAANEHRPLL